MADLNDRFDEINDFNIKGIKIKYNGKAPKSCCYNWDGSCIEKRFNSMDKDKDKDAGFCYFPTDLPANSKFDAKFNIVDETKLEKIDMGTEGEKENYRYRCDKVFGKKPTEGNVIQIYDDQPNNKVSTASDHQMVYALFDDTATDGHV